jgi:formate hydrogenlyase subunit 3/multisubunit Na+/H+ antiporter MnhD subunit
MVAITERDYDGVWLAICALTTLIFPYAYDLAGLHGWTPDSYPWFFSGIIAVRNALLVVATARFIRRSLVRTEAAPDLARSTSPAA